MFAQRFTASASAHAVPVNTGTTAADRDGTAGTALAPTVVDPEEIITSLERDLVLAFCGPTGAGAGPRSYTVQEADAIALVSECSLLPRFRPSNSMKMATCSTPCSTACGFDSGMQLKVMCGYLPRM